MSPIEITKLIKIKIKKLKKALSEKFQNINITELINYNCINNNKIKKLFSSSSLYAIKVVSSAYLRLLIFLLGILIPAWDSPSLAFHMMYPGQKLNEQDDNIKKKKNNAASTATSQDIYIYIWHRTHDGVS